MKKDLMVETMTREELQNEVERLRAIVKQQSKSWGGPTDGYVCPGCARPYTYPETHSSGGSAVRAALVNLLAQVEKFCEEHGEADFYTGEAIAALAGSDVPERVHSVSDAEVEARLTGVREGLSIAQRILWATPCPAFGAAADARDRLRALVAESLRAELERRSEVHNRRTFPPRGPDTCACADPENCKVPIRGCRAGLDVPRGDSHKFVARPTNAGLCWCDQPRESECHRGDSPEVRCYHYAACHAGEEVPGLDLVRCKTCPLHQQELSK